MHAKGRARKRALKGAEHGMSKLTERQVVAIRKSRKFGWVIAKRLGISVATVSDIRTRKTWKHIE
jgi:predicted DNA binding protein